MLIVRIDSIPKNLSKVDREHGRVVLAHGEVTGHSHSISEGGVDLYRDDAGLTFLDVQEAVAALTHQEHATINLESGFYRIIRQREYTEVAVRNVAD